MPHSPIWQAFQSSPKFRVFKRLMRHSQKSPFELLQRIHAEAMESVDYLRENPDQVFSAKQICGRELWSGLERWEASAVGIAFSFLVAVRALPLRFVSRSGVTNKRYSYWCE